MYLHNVSCVAAIGIREFKGLHWLTEIFTSSHMYSRRVHLCLSLNEDCATVTDVLTAHLAMLLPASCSPH